MGRSPAFQCYAKDLYTGTSDLTPAEFGTYWRGICWSWDNGPLPLKPEPRRRALLLDRRDFDRIWPNIRGLWVKSKKGYTNKRLEEIRKEQDDFRENQAKNGKNGAAKRWGRHSKPINPPLANGMANDSSASPISDLHSAQEIKSVGGDALVFPCKGIPIHFTVTDRQVEDWTREYPEVDVLRECRHACEWVVANTDKRPTAAGMVPFLLRWFKREVDPPRSKVQSIKRKLGPNDPGYYEQLAGELA